MTSEIAIGWLAGAVLLLTACQSGETSVAGDDPSKLSAELESEARAIEQRAADGVQAADRAAAADLRRLEAEASANAATADDGRSVDAASDGDAAAASEASANDSTADRADQERAASQP